MGGKGGELHDERAVGVVWLDLDGGRGGRWGVGEVVEVETHDGWGQTIMAGA
jgi:hypothetical protein